MTDLDLADLQAKWPHWQIWIATHTSDEWPEQVALEHLAVLSVVARWTDETEIVY